MSKLYHTLHMEIIAILVLTTALIAILSRDDEKYKRMARRKYAYGRDLIDRANEALRR